MKTSKENEETKNSTHGIRALIEGKRFESYVAMAFTQELCVDKYNQGIKYSYVDEIVKIEDILDSQNIKEDEKNQIIYLLNSNAARKVQVNLVHFQVGPITKVKIRN